MDKGLFDIVFTGELVPGAEREVVKQKLAALFKIAPERADGLFGGRRVVIKRGLNGVAAAKYLHAIRQAGAVAQALDAAGGSPEKSAEPAPPPRPSAAPSETTAPTALSLAEVGATLVEPEEIVEPSIDTSGLSIAEPGALLSEQQDEQVPTIDLSGLSLAPEGSLLSEPEPVESNRIDSDSIGLD